MASLLQDLGTNLNEFSFQIAAAKTRHGVCKLCIEGPMCIISVHKSKPEFAVNAEAHGRNVETFDKTLAGTVVAVLLCCWLTWPLL